MSLRLFKSCVLVLMLAMTLGVLSSPARGQAGVSQTCAQLGFKPGTKGHTDCVNQNSGVGGNKAAPKPASPAPAPAAKAPVVPVITAEQREDKFWDGAMAAGNKEGFDAYLESYPSGRYASMAKANLASLKAALEAAVAQKEDKFWDDAKALGNKEAYQGYLNSYPAGRYVDLAQGNITRLEVASRPPIVPSAAAPTPPPVIAITPPAPKEAAPPPMRAPPAEDIPFAWYVEAARRARGESASASSAPAEDENARATRLAVAAATLQAQNFPVKPIRFIVPYAAGGSSDILSRTVGQKLSEAFGQPVVTDNRPGARGIIGAEAAAKAPPDGYTIHLGDIFTLAVNPHLYLKLPYDALRDFVPITLAATIPVVLVVNPGLPVNTVKQLIALAKARPGQLYYASGGVQHLAMEMLRVESGINIVQVPYKGLAPAFSDLLGGRVPMMFIGVPNVVPHMKTGRLRVLAIGSPKRSPTLSEVPTVAEAGVAGFDFDSWTGYLAPAGTPKEIIVKLHADITRTLGLPEVKDKLTTLGFDLAGGTPDAFATLIKNDIARFGKLIKAAGIQAE